MRCIPCMQCLICVSLGDVWGKVLPYDSDSLPVLSFERFAIHAISLKSKRLIFAFSNVTT